MFTESNTVEAYLYDLLSGAAKVFRQMLFKSPKPPTATATKASVGAVPPAPTFPGNRRKCWWRLGFAMR
jgi:hypothetical protein